MGGHAFAGDYTVSYALDAGDLKDSGTSHDCTYGQSCTIRSDKLDLSVIVAVYLPDRRKPKHASISVLGGRSRLDCCFFPDGVSDFDFDFEKPFVKIGVYEGRRRRRNEFVLNSPLGILYLQFSDTE